MTTCRSSVSFLLIATAVFISGTASAASDTILVHGHIYTGNPKAPWAQALAITGTRIEAVGSDQEISRQQEANTKVIDLQGRTVIPGIIDSHTHILFGAMAIHGFNLSTPQSTITPDDPDALIEKIKAYAGSHTNQKILFGRADFATDPTLAPTRELLDRAVSDRPVIIHNTSEHALWVNTKALALAGLTEKPVADPAEEKYVIRDSSGQPTGVLLEAAMELVERAVARQQSLDDKLALLRDASHYLNRYGITSITNATGSLEEIQLFAALRDRRELTVRTRMSFGAVAVNHHLTPKFLSDLDQARTLYHDDWVSSNLVKFFADGGTGFISPLTYTPAEYKKLVLELDKRGYQIMTHATRFDTTRMVLDTYEDVERINGPRDRRFRLEHGGLLTSEDLPRLAKLSVIISMQPSLCCGDNGADGNPQDRRITDRWQSLEKSGAVLAFGSDWPCTFPPNPFIAIQEAVTRQIWRPAGATSGIPGGALDGTAQAGAVETSEVYSPEERLTVEQAVNAYTRGSAYARFSEDRIGTLEPGKEGDLAVLSQDIFSVDQHEIGRTRVLMTMVGGKAVFTSDEMTAINHGIRLTR